MRSHSDAVKERRGVGERGQEEDELPPDCLCVINAWLGKGSDKRERNRVREAEAEELRSRRRGRDKSRATNRIATRKREGGRDQGRLNEGKKVEHPTPPGPGCVLAKRLPDVSAAGTSRPNNCNIEIG